MIHCEGLVKIYKADELEVVALQGLNLDVEDREMMAIIGNSGSGKSTLLNILGGLDQPTAGQVLVGGTSLLKLTEPQYVEYKRNTVGFIWQNNARNLLPYLTAIENVEMPMLLSGKLDRAYARELLRMVGLEHRMKNKLYQLSGGEQQRVAIAIALSNRPALLLADEPTGSVDTATADKILDIFRLFNREFGVTVVIVTHDMALAKKMDRVVAIRDGLTSTELIKRSTQIDKLARGEVSASELLQSEQHETYAVVDRSGRMQIPSAFMESSGISNRALLELKDGCIIIQAPREHRIVMQQVKNEPPKTDVQAPPQQDTEQPMDATHRPLPVIEQDTVHEQEQNHVAMPPSEPLIAQDRPVPDEKQQPIPITQHVDTPTPLSIVQLREATVHHLLEA
ncbi:MAG: ABC transporter ATP-binding protein, partial [Paenibacillaceae bacterium]|nr:ABC transporter ATP-binding protein [Paenibacillaceae bacterium]